MGRVAASASRAMDGIIDLAVLAFAVWTVLYHLALAFTLHTDLLLGLTALSAPPLAWLLMRPEHRPNHGREQGPPVSGRGAQRELSGSRFAIAAAIVVAVVSALLVEKWHTGQWWPAWALGALAVAVALVVVVGRLQPPVARSVVRVPPGGTLLALGSAAGLGIFAIFTLRSDPDDTFYVNKAAWVAQHGTIAIRDTMFTNQKLPAIGEAGVPVSSIETFQGAVAHLGGFAAGSAVYLLTPALGTFFAVWAIWRLVRAWAPRRLPLCFAVAVVYLIWAAGSGGQLGVFFLARMQQGKVVFVAMVVPLLYVYLTRWAQRASWRTAVLLFGTGVAAVGLTSSATFLVPLIALTVAGPLALQRRYRHALGALLPAVYPVAAGLTVHFAYHALSAAGGLIGPEQTFHDVFGLGWYAVFGWLAVLTAVWFARPGAPQLVAAGVAAMLIVILAPGVLRLMEQITGAQDVLWRTMWVAPVPVMVGLVAAAPVPRGLRWAAPIPGLVAIVALVAVGLPLWAPDRAVQIESHPTWRYPAPYLHQARAIIAAHPGPGPVLSTPATMRAIALITTSVHGVVPLRTYLSILDEPPADHTARLLLSDSVTSSQPTPSAGEVHIALQRLRVSLVCLPSTWAGHRRLFEKAGYVPAGRIGAQQCLRQAPG